jgi:hypothetical protein
MNFSSSAWCQLSQPLNIRPTPKPCITFRNMLIFYREVSVSRPTPKLEDHPLSSIRDSLSAATDSSLLWYYSISGKVYQVNTSPFFER